MKDLNVEIGKVRYRLGLIVIAFCHGSTFAYRQLRPTIAPNRSLAQLLERFAIRWNENGCSVRPKMRQRRWLPQPAGCKSAPSCFADVGIAKIPRQRQSQCHQVRHF